MSQVPRVTTINLTALVITLAALLMTFALRWPLLRTLVISALLSLAPTLLPAPL